MTKAQKAAADELLAKGELARLRIEPLPRDVRDIQHKLLEILRYHRFDPLLEDLPPEPNASDLALIQELREHCATLSREEDRGIGGKLQALYALTCFDRITKDWEALEEHVRRYLQMTAEARLNEMYLVGGITYIEKFIGPGRYEQIDRLVHTCASKAVTINAPESIFRWCSPMGGAATDPGMAVQVLDHLLKRSDLTDLQRYEALAWRAIFLDKIDRLLSDSRTPGRGASVAQKAWFLHNVTAEQITDQTLHAVVDAAQAWGALGPARYAEARPYSTENASEFAMNVTDAPEATRLQETSAKLDAIVQRRTVPQRPSPRVDAPAWRRRRR